MNGTGTAPTLPLADTLNLFVGMVGHIGNIVAVAAVVGVCMLLAPLFRRR